MTRVQWKAYVVPGGSEVDVVADNDTTTPVLSIESPSDVPGGGVTNSAPADSIAVSDGTNLTGSAHLTWDALNRVLGIANDENGGGTFTVLGVGAQLFIFAADGDATHVGGEVEIASGASDGQNSGAMTIRTGNDGSGGSTGGLTISTGRAASGTSGDINIKVSPSAASGVGGSINLQAGTGATGNGGNVNISAGPKQTGGSHGSVWLSSANATYELEVSETLGFRFLGGTVVMDSLPTADPVIAGALWVDTAAGRVLKVSAG